MYETIGTSPHMPGREQRLAPVGVWQEPNSKRTLQSTLVQIDTKLIFM